MQIEHKINSKSLLQYMILWRKSLLSLACSNTLKVICISCNDWNRFKGLKIYFRRRLCLSERLGSEYFSGKSQWNTPKTASKLFSPQMCSLSKHSLETVIIVERLFWLRLYKCVLSSGTLPNRSQTTHIHTEKHTHTIFPD